MRYSSGTVISASLRASSNPFMRSIPVYSILDAITAILRCPKLDQLFAAPAHGSLLSISTQSNSSFSERAVNKNHRHFRTFCSFKENSIKSDSEIQGFRRLFCSIKIEDFSSRFLHHCRNRRSAFRIRSRGVPVPDSEAYSPQKYTGYHRRGLRSSLYGSLQVLLPVHLLHSEVLRSLLRSVSGFSGRTFPPFKYFEIVARDKPVLSLISRIVAAILTPFREQANRFMHSVQCICCFY